jgi:hypothetical protein
MKMGVNERDGRCTYERGWVEDDNENERVNERKDEKEDDMVHQR